MGRDLRSAGELIYTGGRVRRLGGETAEQAEKLVNRIEVLYQETTVAAGSPALISKARELEGPKFQETIAGLVREVRKKKDKKTSTISVSPWMVQIPNPVRLSQSMPKRI